MNTERMTSRVFPGQFFTRDNLYDMSSKAMIFIALLTTILGVWAQRDQIENVLARLTGLEWGVAYLAVARFLFLINTTAQILLKKTGW